MIYVVEKFIIWNFLFFLKMFSDMVTAYVWGSQ